jgi:hypothetical protein
MVIRVEGIGFRDFRVLLLLGFREFRVIRV